MSMMIVDAWQVATGTPNVTIAYPVGISKNDIITVWLSYKVGSVITITGFTEMGFVSQGNTRLSFYAKMADGTESGNLSITVTGGDVSTASILAIRGTRFAPPLATQIVTFAYNNASTASAITYTDPSPNSSRTNSSGGIWLSASVGRNTTATRSGSIAGVGWTYQTTVSIASGGVFVDMPFAIHGALSDNPNDPVCTFSGTETDLVIAIVVIEELDDPIPQTTMYNPWRAPAFDQPTSFTQQQMNQLRANVLAAYVTNSTPFGWDYRPDLYNNNDFTVPGTIDLPSRRYLYHGKPGWDGSRPNNTKVIKQIMRYHKSNVLGVSYFYSDDNGTTYVPMTDDLGNNTVLNSISGGILWASDWKFLQE